MTAQNTPLYTSETGVSHEPPPVIQPAVSKSLRVNDSKYGLKTAAKIAHDKVTEDLQRAEFQRQKAEAIARQRTREAEKKQARVDDLDSQIQRVQTSVIAGQSSDPAKAKRLLESLKRQRQNLVGA